MIFYYVLNSENLGIVPTLTKIDKISDKKIMRDLKPVLRSGERFELEKNKEIVKKFIKDSFEPTENEKMFLSELQAGNYKPNLLFNESNIVERLTNHPMILWKLRERK